MGNCQAVDSAALVIQHPDGKLERMYWSVTASEVMKTNPGHYVSLIIPLPDHVSSGNNDDDGERVKDSDIKDKAVRFTRVKLLTPSDTLVLGRAYRLVTTQEVMKVLRAKKHAKMRREKSQTNQENQNMTLSESETGIRSIQDHSQCKRRPDGSSRHRHRRISANKSWNPSLQSISESGS